LQTRIEILVREDLVKPDEDYGYLPTCLIITLKDGRELSKTAHEFAGEALPIVLKHLPDVIKKYDELEGFKEIPFSGASLLILSDVLLDAWQINDIERLFLKKERTPRNGMNYYFSFQEKLKDQNVEAFGIYGNAYRTYGNLVFGLYGNARNMGANFMTISKNELTEWFGMDEQEDIRKFMGNLLQELVRLVENPGYKIKDTFQTGFEKLNMMNSGKLSIPVIYPGDNKKLIEMKDLVTNDLLQFLEEKKPLLQESYNNSIYAEEVTLEEYLIWWYHFFYTELTEQMITQTIIQRPSTGVISYIVKLRDED